MEIELHLQVSPSDASDMEKLMALAQLHPSVTFPVVHLEILKRSIDARQRKVLIQLRLRVSDKKPNHKAPQAAPHFHVNPTVHQPQIAIIGAGPAGLFAALQLLSQGLKPIVFERGKDVQSRRRDLAAIHKLNLVNSESNYCFGEGGAGTYSDGKLYTRSTKRGDVQKVLETLVHFGATQDILIDAHPHIGTNKLPKVVSSMRQAIIEAGGEVRFESKLTDLIITDNKVSSIEINNAIAIDIDYLILATGHSARDIYELLHKKSIAIDFKPFALGVRVEHPQSIIDQSQYHCEERDPHLPPAAYSLVEQVEGKGVYSFCMCPGGIIAPCATAPNEVVTNGWSPSKRNNPWANSGMVVTVEWDDIKDYHPYGALAGLEFQRSVEQKCHQLAGESQAVPAQRIADFIANKKSENLPRCSYQPGITSVRMDDVLPAFVVTRLRKALPVFGKKIKGFATGDAIMVAPESRTSSPVRIPRDSDTLTHIGVTNLYPCAEGAGYAGGIVSAAIDGIKVAEALAKCNEGAKKP